MTAEVQTNHISFATAIEMMNLFQEGALLFKNPQQPIFINHSLQLHCPELSLKHFAFEQLQLIEQKHTQKRFSLEAWLARLTNEKTASKKMLWLKTSESKTLLPIQLCGHRLSIQNDQYLLIRIIDLTLQLKASAQQTLINTHYAGQFITNQHGQITEPNQAFCDYTSYPQLELQKMTYLDWLKQQVTFSIPFNSVIKALLQDKVWSGEVQIFIDENTIHNAILKLTMLVDDQGNIEHFVGLIQDMTQLKQAQQEIERLAYYDKLTGLPNRTLLHDRIEKTISNHAQKLTFNAIYFIDLDGFKIVNDTLGHAMGDQLLKQVADKLRHIIQPFDTLSRVSGDEFIILRPMTTQDEEDAKIEALAYANKVLDAVDDRYQIGQHSLHSAASVGICLYPLDPGLPEQYRTDELTSFADMAMYEAKKQGGNQAFLFERRLIQQAKQRLELIEALNHSELDEEFQIYFQPQVNQQGQIQSAETLIRWFHPELGFVSPAKFIPVAEEGRQIIKIGLWVLHKAFLQAKAWNKVRPLQVSINISPIQFHEQSFVEIIIGLVKFTQVNPKTITLELTEGVLIRNADLARQKIQHLVSLGFQVSIDDFGTGYSSLSYLQKLPIHELKIDQSFIQQVPGHSDDEAIIDSIINLARTKKLNVVAEGVETAEQANFLIEKHPDVILQGFHFSKPIPAFEFEETFIQPTSKELSA